MNTKTRHEISDEEANELIDNYLKGYSKQIHENKKMQITVYELLGC